MKKFISTVAGLFCIVSIGSQALADDWADAYKRRVFQLGITIDEFRQIKHPDQKEWPNAYPVCTDETMPEKGISFFDLGWFKKTDSRHQLGVIMCEHFYVSSSSSSSSPNGAGLALVNTNSSTSYYFAVPKGGIEPVLYRIDSTGPSQAFSEIASAYERKLGDPHAFYEEELQNGLGAKFTNQIITYENESSQIILTSFGKNLKILSVRYLLKDVYAQVHRAQEELDGNPDDRI